MKPIIMTDASCDLPEGFIKDNNIPFLGLVCHFKGKDYEDDFGRSISYKEFYDGLREGETPSTSQINEFRFTEKFKELLKENRPIIYIGMSSGLSGTFNSAMLALESIKKEYENADITLIDSKCSSIGLGILVYYAYKMLDDGCSKEEIINSIEEKKMKINLWFMVEDLKHLKRGGRVSASKAAIGTLLDIKPIIYMDKEGTLKGVTNIRGRKRAVKYLIEKFKNDSLECEDQIVGISHGDCIKDAEALKDIVQNELGVKTVIMNTLGLGMGTHCGPGMLSLCFIGKER